MPLEIENLNTLQAAPLFSEGQLSLGIIEDGAVSLEGSGFSKQLGHVFLAIAYSDESVSLHRYQISSDGNLKITHPIPEGRVIQLIELVAEQENKPIRFNHSEKNYFLDRILSRDIVEINKNLRWFGRIDHFGTRFFSAINSFSCLQQDPNLSAYCLVAIGYTAIERQHSVAAKIVYEKLTAMLDTQLEQMSTDTKLSFLTHVAHHAVMNHDAPIFERIAATTEGWLPELKSSAIACFNAIILTLLSGLYYLNKGQGKVAATYFSKGDLIFRIAAEGYPRKLVQCHELTVICQRAFLSRVAYEVALGYPLPPELPIKKFSAEATVSQVCRLYESGAKKTFAEEFMLLSGGPSS